MIVGALLCEPADSSCEAGAIFFNNVGYLGMCGHGMIGLVVTLAYLGKIQAGEHRIETPVGIVSAHLHESGAVTINNVVSYRTAKGVRVEVEGYGRLTGDVAWGGNWFFLVSDHGLKVDLQNIEQLTDCTWRIRQGWCARESPVNRVERSTILNSLASRKTEAQTAKTSCFALARLMIALLAEPELAPN